MEYDLPLVWVYIENETESRQRLNKRAWCSISTVTCERTEQKTKSLIKVEIIYRIFVPIAYKYLQQSTYWLRVETSSIHKNVASSHRNKTPQRLTMFFFRNLLAHYSFVIAFNLNAATLSSQVNRSSLTYKSHPNQIQFSFRVFLFVCLFILFIPRGNSFCGMRVRIVALVFLYSICRHNSFSRAMDFLCVFVCFSFNSICQIQANAVVVFISFISSISWCIGIVFFFTLILFLLSLHILNVYKCVVLFLIFFFF